MAGARSVLFVGLLTAACADDADIHLLAPAERPIRLTHRYDFEGRGSAVPDLVGDDDGEIVGGALLADTGALELDGVDDFVNLPNDILGNATRVSLVAWVTWHGGPCWQRIFDLGRSAAGEDLADRATSSIFVTPSSCDASHVGSVDFGVISTMFHAGQSAQVAQGTEPLPMARDVQVVLTLDAAEGLNLYVDSELLVSLKGETDPRSIDCENDWLGRSQWGHDPFFFGGFEEFRVYEGVLTEKDVARLFDRGHDSP